MNEINWMKYILLISVFVLLILLGISFLDERQAKSDMSNDINRITECLKAGTHIKIKYRSHEPVSLTVQEKESTFYNKDKINALASIIKKAKYRHKYDSDAISSNSYFAITIYGKETVLYEFGIVTDNGILAQVTQLGD